MADQTEAQRLADELERRFPKSGKNAAAELRRLDELNKDKTEIIASLSATNLQLLEALEMNLPVIEDYGDLEQLTRQRKAIKAARGQA